MRHFFMFEILEMPHNAYLILKIGYFKYFKLTKMRHFEEKSRDKFSNSKRTENSVIRFQIKTQIPSHEKILLQMLCGPFILPLVHRVH